MEQLTKSDLARLALGSAILGSGGGGDPAYDLLMAQYAFDRFGPVRIIQVSELQDFDLVVPCDFMGAPSISIECLPSGREFCLILEAICKHYGRRPEALIAGEIGGGNAFTPLAIASRMGIPVVDGDLIGRAFPQLQMCAPELKGISATPAFIADGLGNQVTIQSKNAFELEKIARQVAVAMGSSCAVSMYLMSGQQAKEGIVVGSLSRAIQIGGVIESARSAGKSPLNAIVNKCGGFHLASGVICDINQSIKDGFLEGTVTLHTLKGNVQVLYQNEYLLALRSDNTVLATTPDIIMLLDSESGAPIPSERLRYGARAVLIALEAPEIWQTERGLALVGPRYFGYGADYQPISNSVVV